MPLPVSSVSLLCNQVADFLRAALDAAGNGISVLIGHPGDVVLDDPNLGQQLNLFFYRIVPSGVQAEAHPGDPWRLRMFCMITPFGMDDTSIPNQTVSAGDNDLRMLGEVLRVLHQAPLLGAIDVNGEAVRLQAVFQPIDDEQLNQIWSTQGDVAYRVSAVYEFGLAPVVPSVRRAQALTVGALGVEARARLARHAAFVGNVRLPPVLPVVVATDNPAWVPAMCWIYQSNCQKSLAFDVDTPEFAGFAPAVWVVGDPATAVQLVWERWQPTGWQSVGAPIAAQPHTPALDPNALPSGVVGFPTALGALPAVLAPAESSLQLLLYAQRVVNIPGGPGPQTVRSEPLLLTLFRSP